MEINKDYILGEDNYYPEVTKKSQIVIGNTLSMNMEHFKLWENKINGTFKGTAPYTIGLDGTIYEHFDPKYYSKTIRIEDYDKQIIPIVLENEGWIAKDYHNNQLITWSGDIYNRGGENNTVSTKWRGKLRWAPYSNNQLDSLVILCDDLIDRFNINRFVSEHNTKIANIEEKEGIYYRSNYSINYLDVSPAFNFKIFKNKIENNETVE